MGELCAHIVTVHHDGLRKAFPRLERLFGIVVRVHGAATPGSATNSVSSVRSEAAWSRTWPARRTSCSRLHRLGAGGYARRGASAFRARIRACGARPRPRRPADDVRRYDREAALCNTHRALLDALEAFEQDLHRHVHEENNILLPRARTARRARGAERSPASRDHAGADAPTEALPPCCERWIAEQRHSWVAQNRRP